MSACPCVCSLSSPIVGQTPGPIQMKLGTPTQRGVSRKSRSSPRPERRIGVRTAPSSGRVLQLVNKISDIYVPLHA